ncbi:MAG: hypothetical protein ACOYOS_06500 [Syntrophales bacterium]
MKMIINTITTDYENRLAGITYAPVENPIKYFYPLRCGYDKTALMYSLSVPGYTKPETSSLDLEGLLGLRQDVIDAKIRMILKEIDQRRVLKDDNLYKICLDQCTCKTLVHQLGIPYMDKRRLDLEKKTIDLEQEKRQEITNYFKDILFLRKELRESIIENLEETQKMDIFMTKPEETT